MEKILTRSGMLLRAAVVLAVIAVSIQGLWQATRLVRPPERNAGPDFISRCEEKFRAVRAFLTAQTSAETDGGTVVGYLPVYTESATAEDARIAAYYAAQFAMIPWTLEPDPGKSTMLAIADFLEAPAPGWTPPAGWVVDRDFGSVAVLRRTAGGNR